MQLTGPPRLNNWLAPMPSSRAPMRADWRDESTFTEYRDGRLERVGAQRLRGTFRVGWASLSYEDAARLLYELEQPSLSITPRTIRDDDETLYVTDGQLVQLNEDAIPVRLVSDISTLARVAQYTRLGRVSGLIEAEFETLQVYASDPMRSVYPPGYWDVVDNEIERFQQGQDAVIAGSGAVDGTYTINRFTWNPSTEQTDIVIDEQLASFGQVGGTVSGDTLDEQGNVVESWTFDIVEVIDETSVTPGESIIRVDGDQRFTASGFTITAEGDAQITQTARTVVYDGVTYDLPFYTLDAPYAKLWVQDGPDSPFTGSDRWSIYEPGEPGPSAFLNDYDFSADVAGGTLPDDGTSPAPMDVDGALASGSDTDGHYWQASTTECVVTESPTIDPSAAEIQVRWWHEAGSPTFRCLFYLVDADVDEILEIGVNADDDNLYVQFTDDAGVDTNFITADGSVDSGAGEVNTAVIQWDWDEDIILVTVNGVQQISQTLQDKLSAAPRAADAQSAMGRWNGPSLSPDRALEGRLYDLRIR